MLPSALAFLLASVTTHVLTCYVTCAACRTAFQLCNDVVTGTDFVDSNVDAAELQAAYENGMKALDNHQVYGCMRLDSDFACLLACLSAGLLTVLLMCSSAGGNLNAAELQAAYGNKMKALNNHQVCGCTGLDSCFTCLFV
jgi:hypothetical protein